MLFDVAWCVVVWFVVVCDVRCGGVWFGLFVRVLALCVYALFVRGCVMVDCLSFCCVCVCVLACFECVV